MYVYTCVAYAGARSPGQVVPARVDVPADPPARPRPPRECPHQARDPHGRRDQGPAAGEADKDDPRGREEPIPEDGLGVVVVFVPPRGKETSRDTGQELIDWF